MNNKVLIISNMYPSKKYPHYGVFVRNTKEILQEEGYHTKIIALCKEDCKLKKAIAYTRFYLRVFCNIVLSDYDIIYVHYASHCALPVLAADKIKNKKLVVNVHGNDVVPESKADKKYEPIVRKLLKRADYVICPSNYFKQVLIDHYKCETPYVYPSGGINIKNFYPVDKRKAQIHLKLDTKSRYIGYVSRMEINKGWDIFLEAGKFILDQYPDIKLIVVGSGDEWDAYRNLKRKLEIEEKILEYPLLDQRDLLYIYNALDVFVFPTMRRSESLGLVGLEAMACGIKTVLPDKYGPSSYAKNGINSYVFQSGDVGSLRDTIVTALNSTDCEIKKGAVETAAAYSKEGTKDALIGIFKIIGAER